jgi:hypothetical protein
MEEGLKFKCNVHLELFDKEGILKDERWGHNIIPTVGLAYIADRLSSSPTQAIISHIAIGTDSTTPASTDTALGAESDGARTELISFTDSGAVLTIVGVLGAGEGTGVFKEAGIFNSGTKDAGTLLCRLTYDALTKGESETLLITWTITASDDGV